MGLLKKINDLKIDMLTWRRKLHAEPELAFRETNTARFLIDRLRRFGVDEVHSIARTGVVAVIRGTGVSEKSIMLRADMDALPLQEKTGAAHASKINGVMHACGHDGHMAMLLAAAKVLAEARDFTGTVYIVFQPAEENMGGAKRMIDEGFFQKFPADEVYGLHNYPGLPLGMMATGKGDMLAASKEFKATFTGIGGHGARPEDSADVVAAAAEAVLLIKQKAAQILGAETDPAVLSIPVLHSSSHADNILPDTATLAGSMRGYNPNALKTLETEIENIVTQTAFKYGAAFELEFTEGYPVLTNTGAQTDLAIETAREILAPAQVMTSVPKTLGVEDFAHFLKQRPGNFIALGTGPADGKKAPDLHSPKYDFNDAALPIGASYWVRLVQKALPLAGAFRIAPPPAPPKP